MDYALIENGIVTNIIWLNPGNADEFPNAISTYDLSVAIGDTYDGENFYHDGEMIKPTSVQLRDELHEAKTALNILGVIEYDPYEQIGVIEDEQSD